MSITANKRLVRRFFKSVWNERDFGQIDALFADNPLLADATRRTVHGVIVAIPDLHVTIEELIAEGDRVVARWTARGTLRGDLPGLGPTGPLRLTGVYIFRLAGGTIAGLYPLMDRQGLAEQIRSVAGPRLRRN